MLRTLTVLLAVNAAAASRPVAPTAPRLRLHWVDLDGRLTAAWTSAVDVLARPTAS